MPIIIIHIWQFETNGQTYRLSLLPFLTLWPAPVHSPFLLSLLKPVQILGFPGPFPSPIHYTALSWQAIWRVLWIVHYAHMKAITAPVLANSSNIYLLPSEQDVNLPVTLQPWPSYWNKRALLLCTTASALWVWTTAARARSLHSVCVFISLFSLITSVEETQELPLSCRDGTLIFGCVSDRWGPELVSPCCSVMIQASQDPYVTHAFQSF